MARVKYLNNITISACLLQEAAICDLCLPQVSGYNVLANIKEHLAAKKVIILTNYANVSDAGRSMHDKEEHFLDRSFQLMMADEVLDIDLWHKGITLNYQ